MLKQEFYRQEYKKLHPNWDDSQTVFKKTIEKYLGGQTRILDIGCGHTDFLRTAYEKTPHVYGIDPDENALQKNVLIKNKFACEASNMPFENNFFDMAVCAWVFEHFGNPLAALREINRVLVPGGKMIFLTPNAWNYNVWIIRAIPERFHDFFTKKLYGRQEGDTYPKQYKINTPGKIEKLFSAAGFSKSQIILNGDPSYISFNKPLFAFARMIEWMLSSKLLRSMRVHIIGVYEKASNSQACIKSARRP